MLISFSKAWGQDDCKWNFCGGDWNFRTMAGLMEFYGIREAWISGKDTYFENDDDEQAKECNEYTGWATRQIERLKQQWFVPPCMPCKVEKLIRHY